MAIWKEDFIVKNQFSRPAIKLLGVRGIVMHWTATNGATAQNEHDFFDGKDGGGGRYASAHMFVDKNEALLIIPLDEVAYHANEHACRIDKLKATASYYQGGGANLTSIGIEMCVEKDGTIHKDTVSRSVDVVVELCKRYKLDPLKDIYMHYNITGKNCPAPWVADNKQFTDFKKRVNKQLNGTKEESVVVAKPEVKEDKSNKYTIAAGDTYSKISKKFDVSVDDLRKFNPRVNENKLQIGDVIYLIPVPDQTVEVKKQDIKEDKSKPVAKKKYIQLPASAKTWAIYDLNKAPIKKNAKAYLSPKKFGGLTYEVLGNPQADVYTIKTDSFGKVNIYAAPSTGAKIVLK
jgi:N-acetylmuramoyl-L-alanine amidase